MHETFESAGEAWLAHHGVKGMRWGVTRKDPSGGGGGKSAEPKRKVTSEEIIRARQNTAKRVRAINAQADRLNDATSSGASKAKVDAEAKKYRDLSIDYLKNPDRATALRMTRGEKFLATGFAIVVPVAGTAGVAAGASIRVAARKSVEKNVRESQRQYAKK